MSKRVVVIGASPNAERYSFKAVKALKQKGHDVIAVGLKLGDIEGVSIHADKPLIEQVDTVSLYVGPSNQPAWFDYILSLKPKRVILNPGTENKELSELLINSGIVPVEACTLVMLSVGNF